MSLPSRPTAPQERLDGRALLRLRRRLQAAPERPWLHVEAGRRMAERLPWIKARPSRVLDWSADAPGPDNELRQACPGADVVRVIELPASAATAPRPWWQRWAGGPPERRLTVADTAGWGAGLLWSNMRLHLAAEPRDLLRAWRAALAPEGYLLFTTLGPGSLAELRELYRAAGWGSPHAPFVDMHDLGDMMVECGLAEPVMGQETLHLTYGSAEQLLSELRSLGLNADPARFAGWRTPAWRERLLHAWRERAGADGRIALRWELVHGHAFRGADRGPAVAPSTTVPLDAMKLMLRKPGRGA